MLRYRFECFFSMTLPAGSISRLDLGQHLMMTCPSLQAVQDNDTPLGLDVLRNCFRLLMGAEVWAAHGAWYTAGAYTRPLLCSS
jgi:hypothetical protein